MKYAQRLPRIALAGIVAAGMAAAGCATPWFGKAKADSNAHPSVPDDPRGDPRGDQRAAAASYINALCKLPREQRDAQVRELNEAVLPNHATISCGPGSGDGP
jgi:hypothetical protein